MASETSRTAIGVMVIAAFASLRCSADGDAAGSSQGGSGGGSTVATELNGCTAANAEDRLAASADRSIAIAASGLSFSPKCISIEAGQSVTFNGSLSSHPLAPGTPNDPSAGSPDNPIAKTSSGQSVAFSFPVAGAFPYFCQLHGFGSGQGMVGAVYVLP
ncbi:MAG: plastocyanin/azurin family copper-binding protein [Polyangiaceae bacterium]